MAHLLILGLLWHLHNTIYYLLKIQFTLSTEYFLRNMFPKRNKKVKKTGMKKVSKIPILL